MEALFEILVEALMDGFFELICWLISPDGRKH